MNRLVVLGSVNADHVLRVPHFPRPGETLTGHSYQVVPGGKGANQAVAAARLGAAVSFIARIGDDAIGRQMKAGFANDGIDVSAVEQDEHLPTGIAIIYVMVILFLMSISANTQGCINIRCSLLWMVMANLKTML